MKQRIELLKNRSVVIIILTLLLILWMGSIDIHTSNIQNIKISDIDTIEVSATEINNDADSLFNMAVEIIKKYEGWHTAKHYPYVGYGHRLLPSDNFDHNISEEFATEVLKKDLRQKCSVFSECGRDSILLGVLAYNIGEYKIKGGYGYPKSRLYKKIISGDRDIYSTYISHCRWKGVPIKSIKNRRIEEITKLFKE